MCKIRSFWDNFKLFQPFSPLPLPIPTGVQDLQNVNLDMPNAVKYEYTVIGKDIFRNKSGTKSRVNDEKENYFKYR